MHNYKEQNINDEQLEFLTYNNGFLLGCEKIFGCGFAKKIHQSKGPIFIKFKKIHLNVIDFIKIVNK